MIWILQSGFTIAVDLRPRVEILTVYAQENSARRRARKPSAGREESHEERARALFEVPCGRRHSAFERQNFLGL